MEYTLTLGPKVRFGDLGTRNTATSECNTDGSS